MITSTSNKGALNRLAVRVHASYMLRQLFRLRDLARTGGRFSDAAQWQRMIREMVRR